jgi:hypothetical protein
MLGERNKMAKSNTARTKTALLAVIENPAATTEEKLRAATLFSRKPRKRKPKGVTSNDRFEASHVGGRFDWSEFFDRMNQSMYIGSEGKLLREYHDALDRWAAEFHKAGKHSAETNALWDAARSAHKAAFGEESSSGLESRRQQEEYEYAERIRLRSLPPNPCVVTRNLEKGA